ncbi:MAG: hypothetical protein IT463_07030 [Planctomycetes bacterium]|nr:hypothetical protein [Planctomycetota bacterium]
MARKSDNRVASWYWITSAILLPPTALAILLWAYFFHQTQSYRAEGERLFNELEAGHKELDPLLASMKSVSGATGFNMGDPLKALDSLKSNSQLPPAAADQEQKPEEDRSPLYRRMRDAEKRFYGDGGEAGYVHQYQAARKFLQDFDNQLVRYINFKKTQFYVVRTIDIGGQTAVVAAGDLSRQITADAAGAFAPPEAAVDAAWQSSQNTPPAEKFMQAPTVITMELILRKQNQLVEDLVAANQHQHNLLYAEVSSTGRAGDIWVGFEAEKARQAKTASELANFGTQVDQRKNDSLTRLDRSRDSADNARTETSAKKSRYELLTLAAESRIQGLADRFESERAAHETDAGEFDKLTKELPRIKVPIKIEKREPDGEVSFSDYVRKVCHINLGHLDGVRVGQRFEIWRLHGRERDEVIGVVEVMRTLSDHFSLCTVLSLVNEGEPVRKGDKVISRLWHRGKFMTVALHGTFEPPNQAYSKERLAELLKLAGVRVVDKVQPGTDIVILGSSLLSDEWYRKARDDIRFETLKEEDVRLYVDPR